MSDRTIDVADQRAARGGLSGMLLFVVLPLLVLAGVTSVVAVLMWAFGGSAPGMLLAASALSGPAALLGALLLYRQADIRNTAQRSLTSAEARIGGLEESAMDAIIAIDEQQTIVLFNPAAERVFGWKAGLVLGRRLDMLIPERFRSGHQQH